MFSEAFWCCAGCFCATYLHWIWGTDMVDPYENEVKPLLYDCCGIGGPHTVQMVKSFQSPPEQEMEK